MRIGGRRPVVARRHFVGVVGIVRAGAIDRRGKAHRGEQFSPRERAALGLSAAFSGTFADASGSHAQCTVRGAPVGEDAEDGRISGLAGQRHGIEHLVVDDEPGARPIAGLIGREFVAGGFCHRPLRSNLDRDKTAI